MGLGYALTEELKVEQGRVLNPAFRDYHLLTAPEVPPIQFEFIETEDPTRPVRREGRRRGAGHLRGGGGGERGATTRPACASPGCRSPRSACSTGSSRPA